MNAPATIADRPARWREFLNERTAQGQDAQELESELNRHLAEIDSAGLTDDERFTIALARLEADGLAEASASTDRSEFWLVLACAFGAALAYKMTNFFGLGIDPPGEEFYTRNLMFLVLPFLAIYFAVRGKVAAKPIAVVAGIFAALATVVNVYPFVASGSTELLAGLHLPILLWLVTGVLYAAGEWRSVERRMEYTKFTGEWIINFGLISIGVGVLSAITIGIFEAVLFDASAFMKEWVIPSCITGAVVVAGWLVSQRKGLSAGIAPWLAKLFTPLFALMVLAVIGAIAITGGGVAVDRELLIVFDLLLVVVTALLLYGIAARDPIAKPAAFDWIQLVLVVGALVVDAYALASMAGRLAEFGASPNRVAAFGLNVILLANLGWSAVLLTGFLRGRRAFADLAKWQMSYLPVYAGWAAVVVVVLPLVFGFA